MFIKLNVSPINVLDLYIGYIAIQRKISPSDFVSQHPLAPLNNIGSGFIP